MLILQRVLIFNLNSKETMMQEQVSLLELQLADAINESLQNHIPSNATFLAERLLAERDTEQNRSLLAECYMAENKHYKVFYILKDCVSEMNKYKFAVSCVKISKFKEAEKALLGAEHGKQTKNLDSIPNGSYGLYLMGVIAEKSQRCGQAREYYLKAIEINPTLWSAYEKLGKLGENIMPNKVFIETRMKNYEAQRKPATAQRRRKQQENQNTQKLRRTQAANMTNTGGLVRRKSIVGSNSQIPNITTLLKKFADGCYYLNAYKCQQAIEQFNKLPPQHYNTGWVLTNVGKAYMEIVKYQQAANCYEQAYKIEPHRTEGIEHYSSCLWHLKKQVELCYLAHQSLEKSLFIPEAWIAVGNCFSLQKEHDQAINFFNRAIKLNPYNPYAYSLCGHEHVYNEDFPKAKKMFEQAINLDVRHYSAWWGQGNIAYKQEKYDRACQFFKRAIQINGKNPVLYSFMGMTLAAKRDFHEALQQFKKSQKYDNKNGLNKFQKANTLVKLQRYDQAIQQLESLQNFMPKQAPIPMLLGKIYKKKGINDKAHYYFNMALDLESKDAQKIKGFIESLHNSGGDDEMDI